MSSALIDHLVLARSRVATQYSQSQNFLAYLDALMSYAVELEAALQDVAIQADIDQAEGVNLDVIGDIVGVQRIVFAAMPMLFFGFAGQPGAAPFGEEGNLSVGARFRDEEELAFDTSVLSDLEYRSLIRAKIAKNHSLGTAPNILTGLAFIFDSVPIYVYDPGGMVISLAIGRFLTYQEQVLLKQFDIAPRPAAVRIGQYVMFDSTNYFGFEDFAGATQFGEEGQPFIGGPFAEEF